MTNKFRWGLIGPGTIARKFATAVKDMEDAELYAVASRSDERAKAFAAEFGVEKAYGNYEDMLSDPLVEAVYVSTTNPYHYACIKQCLLADKPVLCEKPLALNVNQATELLELARKRDLFIMEGMWTRCLPIHAQVSEWIVQGKIGDVRAIHADFCFDMRAKLGCRQLDIHQGGGALLDAGVYNLMLAIKYFGDAPKRVLSVPDYYKTGVDLTETIMLEYSDARTAVLTSSVGLNVPNDAYIYGTKGYIHLPMYWCGKTATLHQYGASIFAPMASEQADRAFASTGFQFEIAEAMRCIRAGETESPLIPRNDTLAAQRIMTELRKEWGIRFPGNMYE